MSSTQSITLFQTWAQGSGVVAHNHPTQERITELAKNLLTKGQIESKENFFELFRAADILTNAAMWLVVHMTYANKVYTSGQALAEEDFKNRPQGHTGGALNMVPAYVGYMLANALSGKTRAWLMGQGHCVAAIDAVNLLLGNLSPEQERRYEFSDPGLSRFVTDFYSNKTTAEGLPDSPLGSHVNPYTAGGLQEGGYLGFAELYYPHMPLPEEELVVFLSDGAFEEQRGSDWAPRWWRAEDTGAVIPIMIANGRRIDQRTTMSQQGGVEWFKKHLELNNFAPQIINGRDPADFAWAILTASQSFRDLKVEADLEYPIRLPYAIAETVKGFGFPNAGTNASHNLPLGEALVEDPEKRKLFNSGTKALWQNRVEILAARRSLNNHSISGREKERNHPLTKINIEKINCPELEYKALDKELSPMSAIDQYFANLVSQNSQLRPRVGNPDELKSNRMYQTLELLKHRVTTPEAGMEEDKLGKVITALNEEAVVCAALANKKGINIVVSYEAFATKMYGALRQEIIFSKQQIELKRSPGWLSVPVILTSHTWENGKNQQSHQDPTLCENLLLEMNDVSRVIFPADYNTAALALNLCFSSKGQIWTMVVPKNEMKVVFDKQQAEELLDKGVICLKAVENSQVQLVAIGAYQLCEAQRALQRLEGRGIKVSLFYMIEPGRFRTPRDEHEARYVIDKYYSETIFTKGAKAQIVISHCRPEILRGMLPILTASSEKTEWLGYINKGGTLDVPGMLFANRSCWADIVLVASQQLGIPLEDLLLGTEIAAVRREGDPQELNDLLGK